MAYNNAKAGRAREAGKATGRTAVANLTVGPGTPAAATVDNGAAYSQATANNNTATLAAKLNALLDELRAQGTIA